MFDFCNPFGYWDDPCYCHTMIMITVLITMSNLVPLLEVLCTSTSISIWVLGFTFVSFAVLFRKEKLCRRKKAVSQSRDGRRIRLRLAHIGADGVSATVGICECKSRWSWKFETMQWPAFWSNRIFLGAYYQKFHSKHAKGTLWWKAQRRAYNAKFFEWSKDNDTKMKRNRLNTSLLHRGNTFNRDKNVPALAKWWKQWEAPSKPLAADDPLLLPEREVHAEIGINWFWDRYTLSHPQGENQNPRRIVTLGWTPW